MANINTQKITYYLKTRLITTQNAVIAFATIIAISWAWGAVSVMERNYKLQRELATKERQLKLVELEKATLAYQKKYYESDEYKELAVRKRLGLAFPGEKALILPENSKRASRWDDQQDAEKVRATVTVAPTNTEQWLNFLFGGNIRNLQQ